MKKVIKNYLTQLKENDKKGFSLVELIIVMAIMAILVGIVASQVLPYMEKSRQSKDQQQLSGIATDIVSAIANAAVPLNSDVTGDEMTSASFKLFSVQDTAGRVDEEFYTLRSKSDTKTAISEVAGKLKSKAATDSTKGNKKIFMDYNATTGVVSVYMTENGSASGNKVAKLTVESE